MGVGCEELRDRRACIHELLRQYLYFCTSKASKLSDRHAWEPRLYQHALMRRNDFGELYVCVAPEVALELLQVRSNSCQRPPLFFE